MGRGMEILRRYIQADFAQEDPTAPDYIKNKHLATGGLGENDVVDEAIENEKRPISSHGVYMIVGNVEAYLETI